MHTEGRRPHETGGQRDSQDPGSGRGGRDHPPDAVGSPARPDFWPPDCDRPTLLSAPSTQGLVTTAPEADTAVKTGFRGVRGPSPCGRACLRQRPGWTSTASPCPPCGARALRRQFAPSVPAAQGPRGPSPFLPWYAVTTVQRVSSEALKVTSCLPSSNPNVWVAAWPDWAEPSKQTAQSLLFLRPDRRPSRRPPKHRNSEVPESNGNSV